MEIKIKVGVVVTNKMSQVLLIKEKTQKSTIAKWNIIKGTYEGRETIFETAIRECREEASIDVELNLSLGVLISESGNQQRTQFNFVAKVVAGQAQISPKDVQNKLAENIVEVRWYSREELLRLEEEDFISKRAHEVIRSWLNGDVYPLEVIEHVGM